MDLLDLGDRSVWEPGGGIPGFIAGGFYVPESGIAVAAAGNDPAGGDLGDLLEQIITAASPS